MEVEASRGTPRWEAEERATGVEVCGRVTGTVVVSETSRAASESQEESSVTSTEFSTRHNRVSAGSTTRSMARCNSTCGLKSISVAMVEMSLLMTLTTLITKGRVLTSLRHRETAVRDREPRKKG